MDIMDEMVGLCIYVCALSTAGHFDILVHSYYRYRLIAHYDTVTIIILVGTTYMRVMHMGHFCVRYVEWGISVYGMWTSRRTTCGCFLSARWKDRRSGITDYKHSRRS